MTVNAGDAGRDIRNPEGQQRALGISPQDINVNVFGPVGFEQSGRLAISTRDVNTFSIGAFIVDFNTTVPAIVDPGRQTLQLAGQAVCSGRAFESLDWPSQVNRSCHVSR